MVIRQLLKHYYPAILVFICLTAFSFYTYHELLKATDARREKLFELRVARATEVLNKRMIDYIQILKGCQAIFYTSDTVDASIWKTYVENLNLSANYPGIQAMAYATCIKRAEVNQLENSMRAGGYPGFRVNSTLKNDFLAPIILIEPFNKRNQRAFGFDMYSEARRREAIERALLTGEPAISRKVTLMQETDKNIQPGFLLYLPVYTNPTAALTANGRQKNIRGMVYNPFRAYDLMQAIFKSFSDLHIEIYDGDLKENEQLLFRSSTGVETQRKKHSHLMSVSNISIAGTLWRMYVTPTDKFGSSIENREPGLVLFFGLMTTFLIVIISITILKNKKGAFEQLMLSKEIERKKDEFIGIASHELKTPLTSIKAYIQLLSRSNLKDSDQNLVKKAQRQVKKLQNLIADLLDVSKIQAGRLVLNKTNFLLNDLIQDSIETVTHMYAGHEIVLTSPIPDVAITADKFRLEQAITNLLVNGIKYSPGASAVYISVSATLDKVQILVKDKGIGISQENQKHIFEKFYRAEDLSTNLSGLGMGLFISDEIVKRHGGRIRVKSEVGKGSAFSIELPRLSTFTYPIQTKK